MLQIESTKSNQPTKKQTQQLIYQLIINNNLTNNKIYHF
jgi:hypothetical protein